MDHDCETSDEWGPLRFTARRAIPCYPRIYVRRTQLRGEELVRAAIIHVDEQFPYRPKHQQDLLVRRRLRGLSVDAHVAISIGRDRERYQRIAQDIRRVPLYAFHDWGRVQDQAGPSRPTPPSPAPVPGSPQYTPASPPYSPIPPIRFPDLFISWTPASPDLAPPSPQYTPAAVQGTPADPIVIDSDPEDPSEDEEPSEGTDIGPI